MALLRLLLALQLVLFSAAVAGGEEAPVRLDADIARRVIAVGDTFRLDIDVVWKDGVNVKPLALGEQIGQFAVRDIAYGPTVAADGSSSRRTSLLLTVFDTGELTLPPIALVYMDEAGGAGRVETPPMTIRVESVLPEDAADIRDIKPPVDVPRRWKDLILSWVLLIGLGTVAATSVLVSVRRREEIEAAVRRFWLRVSGPVVRFVRWLLMRLSLIGRDEYGAPAFDAGVAEPYLTPEQAAMKELGRIEGLELVEQGRFKQHYSLVSGAVRRYLERRFRVLAMESPTSYTMAAIGRKDVAPGTLDLIGSLLQDTDLVKFAKVVPAVGDAGVLLERGRQVVRLTGRPVPGEAGPEVGEP